MQSSINRLLAPLRRRLALVVSRAIVTLVDDATRMQTQQLNLLAGETLEGAEHWQPYGFTYRPHTGAEALVLAVGGHRAHSVIIACADRRYRLTGLADGEVALYSDEGDRIHLKRGRRIEVQTLTLQVDAGAEAIFNTPLARFSGDVLVGQSLNVSEDLDVLGNMTGAGTLTTDGDQVAAGVSQINHPHAGVMPGQGQSGKPVPA